MTDKTRWMVMGLTILVIVAIFVIAATGVFSNACPCFL